MDLEFLKGIAPALLAGLENTLLLAVIAVPAALAIGFLCAGLLWMRIPVLGRVIRLYIELFRSTPNLVQVFFLFFVMPSFGVRLSDFSVGIVSLALWGGAYNAENFRAGFSSVGRGLLEASSALALTPIQTFLLVVVPLGTRIAIPSMTNTSISVLKATSLMTVIGYPELTSAGLLIVYDTFRIAETFLALTALYLAVIWGLAWIAHRMSMHWQVVEV